MATSGAEAAATVGGHGVDQRRGLPAITLAALGVVFGDIGTSPLYAVRESFELEGGLVPSQDSVLGMLSLMFWSLVFIVTLKYVFLMLRADNRGEGGILALATLAVRGAGAKPGRRTLVLVLAVMGLSLFYGDALITPAISVLSATEGLATYNPAFEPFVAPLALLVLAGLFLIQRFGTGSVGTLFGPIILLWFLCLAAMGAAEIYQHPSVLKALSPHYAIKLFHDSGWHAFVAMGAIVLCITGAEAVYADMGHFGAKPIRIAWLGMVLPSLVLNYFGQGALILNRPEDAHHPFFLLAPDWALLPVIALATAATVIASQAVITGVFSLTHQAIQLGYLPRMVVRHTSHTEAGQIYVPRMNWLLMAGVMALVLGFGSSGALAAAYGIAVTGTMLASTILLGFLSVWQWRWKLWMALALFGGFFVIDLTYFAANVLKIPDGGWFPLVVGLVIAFAIRTWRRGRRVVYRRLYEDALSVDSFLKKVDRIGTRVPGTAIFMTSNFDVVPAPLLHNLKHNHVLHERVVLMTVRFADEPTVPASERVEVERLGKGFYRITATFGFMDEPDVPAALQLCRAHSLAFDPMSTSFFLGRETLIASSRTDLGRVEERLFEVLSAGAQSATHYFRLPPNRVVELGSQVEI